MNPGRLPLVLLLLLAGIPSGCRPDRNPGWQGYAEGDYIRVASPLPGTVLERPVERGTVVRSGDLLFRLDTEAERTTAEESRQRVAQAGARLENLRKGRRPSELEAAEARVSQAQATLALQESELTRQEHLLRDGVSTPAERDLVRSRRDASRAQWEAATAELATARLGARDDEIRAAEAELAAARAALARAQWALDQKTRTAPAPGRVHETYVNPGEFTPAGQPVVSLLPETNLHVRFFVPETALAQLPVGTPLRIRVDGMAEPIPGRVRMQAVQPEYTPPVIYSREARSRLVYRIEAALDPADARRLGPGQPVDVFAASAETVPTP